MMLNVESKVTEATVYRIGALVTRNAQVHLEQGNQEICFCNVSNSMVSETLQIDIPEGVYCSQVQYVAQYVNEEQRIADSKELEKLKYKKEKLENALELEENVCKFLSQGNFLKIQADSSIDLLKVYVEYIYHKQTEVLERKEELREQIRELDKQIEKLKQKIDGNVPEAKKHGAILLKLQVVSAGDYPIKIKGYDKNVGWYPSYDIRITNLSLPLEVIFKGKIIQRTREDWDNIRLTVSTGNLGKSNKQPDLKVWNLERTPRPLYSNLKGGETAVLPGDSSFFEATPLLPPPTMRLPDSENSWDDDALFWAKLKKSQEFELLNDSVEYVLDGFYDIKGTKDENIVEIAQHNIPANFCYYTTPKAECSAFLMAFVKNWRAMNWVKCCANIYMGNRYIGETQIDPMSTDDVLKISLGRDRNILVDRRKIKHQYSQNRRGNLQMVECEYQLSVKNNKHEPIHVVIVDQIPISNREQVTVEIMNLSNAALEKETGKLTWEYQMFPGQEANITIAFRVQGPKKEYVNI